MNINELDDWFFEDKPKYECEMCDELATFRVICGEVGEASYVCNEDLDIFMCPECKAERLDYGDG